MLLVSLSAGGVFHKTVLYILEHTDMGSRGVILNRSLRNAAGVALHATSSNRFNISLRDGGPVQMTGLYCIHNVEGVPGAERLFPGRPIFMNQSRVSLQMLKSITAART